MHAEPTEAGAGPEPAPSPGPTLWTWAAPFLAVFGLAVALFALAVLLDLWWPTVAGAPPTVDALTDALLRQDLEQARNTLGGLGEVMAAVLGLALTVSSIIVQLAATRFTPHVTALFFRDRTNFLILGFFVTASVFVLWVNFSLGPAYVSRWGVLGSMVVMTVSLLLLFPYFAYVFDFLDPGRIIGRIMNDGLRAAVPPCSADPDVCRARRRTATRAIDHLANIGLNALQQKDKDIASAAIDALEHLSVTYGDRKHALPEDFFRFGPALRQTPDFISLSDESIDDLMQRRTFLEWKILRQYQMLFGEALHQMKDTCYLLAIDTRRIGEAAGRRGDVHTLDLAIKFFNTYMRATINASDIRTAYNILHQYRQLGEFAITRGATTADDDLADRARQIAGFMRYYGSLCYQRGLTFVTEVIAHDVGQLCEVAFKTKSPVHDALLEIFLTVDESPETEEQETTLRGVRRAQVKLATTYLLHGRRDLAARIQRDMATEPPARLRSIWRELAQLEDREFWEVNDRGTNFDYLTPQQKSRLGEFFAAFAGLQPEDEEGGGARTDGGA
ncbi:MAG: DUF2254 domain-containing protein [Deltaproteobacteria bacterium]|nr:MAG: DUF2254 domain-containing protein [Deltaproteobacteria bacterium]